MEPDCENLLIGVTGSAAAVQITQYLVKLRQTFAKNIYIMMSQAAQNFVPAYTLELYSGNPVTTDDFKINGEIRVPHIQLAQRADLFLIMPATANIIGKAAHAICDDLISTTIVACQAPIVLVPSMNEVMWKNRLVQRNIATLKEVGYFFLDPGEGYALSDPTHLGKGVIPPIDSILLSLKAIRAMTREVDPPRTEDNE